MKKLILNIITTILVLNLAWIVVSTIEVNFKHYTPNPTYSCWNYYCVWTNILD